MFGHTTEKRIVRDADKISSMKEELDALSWGRVLEIGKQLQQRKDQSSDIEIGTELVAIAQTNISLAMRLGIDPAPPESRMMASGVEMLEGGMAQAAFDAEAKAGATKSSEVNVSSGLGETESEDDGFGFDPQEPAGVVPGLSTTELPIALPSLGLGKKKNKVVHEVKQPACEAPIVPDSTPATAPEQVPVPAPQQPTPAPQQQVPAPQQAAPAPQPSVPQQAAPAPQSSVPQQAAPAPAPQLSVLQQPVPAPVSQQPAPAPAPQQEPFVAASPQRQVESEPTPSAVAPHDSSTQNHEAKSLPKAQPSRFARFHNLYESRDGSLCVFEDEHGHLVAVDSSKLA